MRNPESNDAEHGQYKQEDVDNSQVEEHTVCLHRPHHCVERFIHVKVAGKSRTNRQQKYNVIGESYSFNTISLMGFDKLLSVIVHMQRNPI